MSGIIKEQLEELRDIVAEVKLYSITDMIEMQVMAMDKINLIITLETGLENNRQHNARTRK